MYIRRFPASVICVQCHLIHVGYPPSEESCTRLAIPVSCTRHGLRVILYATSFRIKITHKRISCTRRHGRHRHFRTTGSLNRIDSPRTFLVIQYNVILKWRPFDARHMNVVKIRILVVIGHRPIDNVYNVLSFSRINRRQSNSAIGVREGRCIIFLQQRSLSQCHIRTELFRGSICEQIDPIIDVLISIPIQIDGELQNSLPGESDL